MKVTTTQGDIEHTDLEVRDVIVWGENCRVVATEWYRSEELVRRDVWVNGLHIPEIGVKHGG